MIRGGLGQLVKIVFMIALIAAIWAGLWFTVAAEQKPSMDAPAYDRQKKTQQ